MSGKANSLFTLEYAAAITGCITIAGYGSVLSWSSPALPRLREESKLLLTLNQESWIASIYSLGFIIGFFINPIFVDRIGRKWTLMIFSIPQISSWILIIIAENFINLLIARLMAGIGYGGGLCAMTVYMTEIGNKNNRGIFLILIRLSMGIGIMFTMIVGAYLSYIKMNITLLMLPVSFVILFSFMPDSSYFLEINKKIELEELKKIKISKSKEIKIQDSVLNSDDEIGYNLSNNSNEEIRLNYAKTNISNNLFNYKETNFWKLFANLNNRKALAVVILTGLTNVLSGQVVFVAYGQKILTHKYSYIDPKKAMVILSSLNVISCFISTQFIEKINRKTLLIISGMICTLCLFISGIYFYLENNNINLYYIGWIPFCCLSIYDILISIGPSNIFYIYQGEFFSNDVKSIAVTVVKFIYIGLSFFSVLNFQPIQEIIGLQYFFFICGIYCFFGIIMVYNMAPETQGRTLEEIQESMQRKNFFINIQNFFRKKKLNLEI